MKQLSIILLASILAFTSCKKDEDDDITPTTNTNENFVGSYTLSMDGQTLSTKLSDVLYVIDYNRIEIRGKGANEEIFTLFINDIPSTNNTPFSCESGSITLTYDGIFYSTGVNTNSTITRISSTKVKFDNIVVSDVIGTSSKTFSGEANIGRETTL